MPACKAAQKQLEQSAATKLCTLHTTIMPARTPLVAEACTSSLQVIRERMASTNQIQSNQHRAPMGNIKSNGGLPDSPLYLHAAHDAKGIMCGSAPT